MNEEELFRQRLDTEFEGMKINHLNELGNRAIALGLIIGHGHHGGKYEILHKGKALLMTPKEAQEYLEALIKNAES
ncbi:MAG: hypothetical protein ACOC3E_00955 [Cyanobacteriota bacterium]